MSGKCIYLFMWGYQDSYRVHTQILARNVLDKLGAPAEAEVLLVGARSPDCNNLNPVCVEPETGKWSLSLFEDLLDAVESTYQSHHMQHMFFGDEASMRDKPEWMRCDSVTRSVSEALEIYDKKNNVTSFCGDACRVNDYYVTPVIQVPHTTFERFPPLPDKAAKEAQRLVGYRSLIHAAMYRVLREATEELKRPEPGRATFGRTREAEEVVRIAAKDFLHTPGLAIDKNYLHTDLFDAFNLVSSLMYEGAKGIGQLILIDPDNDAVEFLLRFVEPVSFHEPRWMRKVLQMAVNGVGIIANTQKIYGLGKLKSSHDHSAQDAFTVDFIDHYHWELRCGNQALLRSHYGVPKLPKAPVERMAFLANYTRLFPLSTEENAVNLWDLLLAQANQEYGSMIVVAEDAVNEARRLSKQGTSIEPTLLTKSLLQSVSGIDGTILLDPNGFCHAIGIILDGEATEQCTPSRGSRYNSGVRYVQSSCSRRLAIVVSDDRTVDIIPKIRGLASRSRIERQVTTLEEATLDNFHDSRNWLDNHRFYINAEQCTRVNNAIDRLDSLPREVGFIYFDIEKFETHPEMDESYLCD